MLKMDSFLTIFYSDFYWTNNNLGQSGIYSHPKMNHKVMKDSPWDCYEGLGMRQVQIVNNREL